MWARHIPQDIEYWPHSGLLQLALPSAVDCNPPTTDHSYKKLEKQHFQSALGKRGSLLSRNLESTIASSRCTLNFDEWVSNLL